MLAIHKLVMARAELYMFSQHIDIHCAIQKRVGWLTDAQVVCMGKTDSMVRHDQKCVELNRLRSITHMAFTYATVGGVCSLRLCEVASYPCWGFLPLR